MRYFSGRIDLDESVSATLANLFQRYVSRPSSRVPFRLGGCFSRSTLSIGCLMKLYQVVVYGLLLSFEMVRGDGFELCSLGCRLPEGLQELTLFLNGVRFRHGGLRLLGLSAHVALRLIHDLR